MEADLKRFSVQFITLETRKDRKGATEFFARHGYRKVQELPKYYASEPGIRMRKEVDQKEACVQRAAH
jgi:ribosomal protein S18 acetylase RimI-like enzyme